MAFAQPMALLAFLLFIPIVLLYLLKQRRRRVQVSTLLFWDQILKDEHSVTSLTRLRKLLSLLLQLLFVALLTLALARPVFSRDMLGARRMVVLLDTSGSMNVIEDGGTRFELAKKRAEEIIRGMAQGDSLMLVSVAEMPDIVLPFTDSRRDLLEALESLGPSHGGTDFAAAFQLLDHLPPDKRKTSVYIVTDGAFDPVEKDFPEELRFAYVPVGAATDNVGITSFRLRPLPASPRDFEIMFEATNASKTEKTVTFDVQVGGRLIDAGELTLGPGASEVRTVRQFSREGGAVEVALASEDAFPLDDRAYGVLPDPEALPVRLVTEGNLFLESALLTDDEIALETVAPVDYAATEGAPAVTVFDRWAPETTPPGNVIFIGAWPADLGLATEGDLAEPLITDWERDHPVNRHLHLTNIAIRKAVRVKEAPEYQTLIRSFADPLVLLHEGEDGKRLAIAFDTTDSDLPLRVAFPILVANAIRHMAAVETGDVWQGPALGEVLTAEAWDRYLPRHADGDAHGSVARVLRPGEDLPEGPVEEAADPPAAVTVDRAGVYTAVLADGDRVPLFAANLDNRRESWIAPSEKLPVTSSRPLMEVDDGFRVGAEPWFVLALLALALLSVEWVLFHRRRVE